eukprot:TRINITY_DN539_c0_g1_i13.p1 TRINITY_DN539_c0_g1~~TRINITY_DN539_c0_g1_i13.p1  ORF type:complete len:272 (-),score=24.93 TRINITY_DN539_c0_g1_i13:1676-2491(-)
MKAGVMLFENRSDLSHEEFIDMVLKGFHDRNRHLKEYTVLSSNRHYWRSQITLLTGQLSYQKVYVLWIKTYLVWFDVGKASQYRKTLVYAFTFGSFCEKPHPLAWTRNRIEEFLRKNCDATPRSIYLDYNGLFDHEFSSRLDFVPPILQITTDTVFNIKSNLIKEMEKQQISINELKKQYKNSGNPFIRDIGSSPFSVGLFDNRTLKRVSKWVRSTNNKKYGVDWTHIEIDTTFKLGNFWVSVMALKALDHPQKKVRICMVNPHKENFEAL